MRHLLLLACAWLALPAAAVSAAPESAPGLERVREAVAAAVAQKFGAGVQVVVGELRADASDAADLVAVPDPGGRTGRPAQFALRAGTKRAGTAVATVTVVATHVRTTAPMARDAAISAEVVREQHGEVDDVRFEPLPQLDDVVGSVVRRAVAPGEVLSHAVVAVPDAVQAGDEVKVVVRVGALEAWGVGRASGSGRVGDVVRITRGSAKGLQRAKVLSPGVVEVLLEQPQEIR
jgi:flagella basal body P-ring formation protein FlgA